MAALVLSALWIAPAQAHAIVESTEPGIDKVVAEAPSRVVMRFNEPVELSFGALRVFDTNGDRVDVGEADHVEGDPTAIYVDLEDDLDKGTYTVTWRILSIDGHPIAEAFVFHVQEPGENPEGIASELLKGDSGTDGVTGVVAGLLRWAAFASLLLLCGATLFLFLCWWRTERSDDAIDSGFGKAWSIVSIVSWVVALVSSVGLFVTHGAIAGQVSLGEAVKPEILRQVVDTRYGKVMLARLALLVVWFGIWVWIRRGWRAEGLPKSTARAVSVLGSVVIVALLTTPGLGGHAGATEPEMVNVAADTAHLVAAAAWFGGLVMLVAVVLRATRPLDETARVQVLAPVLARFSDVALVSVGVIVATGLYRAWTEVQAWRALTGATYGVVLLVKVAIFIPVVALGALNNRRSKPRLLRAARGETEARIPSVRRIVMAEIGLILVVLVASALLVNLPPARVAAGVTGPFIVDVRLEDQNLNVLVDPNQVGENEVHLTATTPEGGPVDVKEMRVAFTMPDQDIGPLVADATKLAPGHFVVQGRQLSVAGEWEIEVIARISRFEELRGRALVEVNG